MSIVDPAEARPTDGLAVDFVKAGRAELGETVQRVRDRRPRTNIDGIASLDDGIGAPNPTT